MRLEPHRVLSRGEVPKFTRPHTSKVLQCFLNADLRCGHEGLSALAKQSGIDITKLQPGQYVLFINSSKDKLKLYASNNVVAYLKLSTGQRLNMATIQLIPKAFQGTGRIDYDKALKEVLLTALARKRG